MKEKLIELKQLREKMSDLNEKKKVINQNYLKENNDLFSEIENISEQVTMAEIQIKEIALIKYSETGEKKLEYGVGIRIMKKLEYDDVAALNWAKEHSMALSLDKRSFDKIARADPMDFVQIKESPQATIPFVIEVKNES